MAPEAAEDLLALDEALARLAAEDPLSADLVKLRYFAGLTTPQAAELLGISPAKPTSRGLLPGLGYAGKSTGLAAGHTISRQWEISLRESTISVALISGGPVQHGVPIMRERDIFIEALEGASWRAGRVSGRGLPGDPGLREHVEQLIFEHEKQRASSWIRPRPASRRPQRSTSPPWKNPAPRSAPTSCCSRSAKGALASCTWPSRRAGRAARGAEDHQAGHGHPASDRAVRGRTTGVGHDGPSEHRQGLRCGHDGLRPALFRDGTGQRNPDHAVLRRTAS